MAAILKRPIRANTVWRYCLPEEHSDHRKPRTAEMRAIYRASGGVVDANAIYGLDREAPIAPVAAVADLRPPRSVAMLSARARKGWRTRKAMQQARKQR